MSPSIAIIICTEPGLLERQSVLFAKSLRKFGGSLSNIPIYSFQPRLGANLSRKTLESFDSLHVTHQKKLLNTKFPVYGVANKPYVCAYAEETLNVDILVFMDSDQCCLSEPNHLLLPQDYDVAVRPEDLNLIGSKGENSKNENYWRKLYEICDTKHELFVTTTVDHQRIRAYWNSGLVAVKRSKGIFQAWKDNFEQVMALELQPDRGLFFVEQSVLSATICALTDAILTLPISYNYPLNMQHRLQEQKIIDLSDTVSIHYHKVFREEYEVALEQLELLKNSDKYQWLYQELKQQNAERSLQEKFLQQFKKQVYRWIKLLGLNKTIEKIIKRPLP